MSDVQWADLELILAISEAGSALGACQRLGVNQSTVSRKLASLERRVGLVLFDRRGRSLKPTPAASELVEVARGFNDKLEDATLRLQSHSNTDCGSVHVTGLRPILRLILTDLGELAEQKPGLSIVVDTRTDFANLSRKEADIALRAARAPEETLVGCRIGKIAYGLYRLKDQQTTKNLIIFPPPRGNLADAPWLSRVLSDTKVGLQIVDDDLQLDAVKASAGLAQLICATADKDPLLERVPGAPLEYGEDLWILTHEHLRHTRRVKLVFDTILARLQAYKKLIEGDAP